MPAYSEVCTYDTALAALDFRIDLKEGFERAVAADLKDGAEGALEKMAEGDAEAFNALSTVAVCTYYMDQKVRELIGYPGQESVTYDSKATQPYLVDGSLAKVIARGQTYRSTPGL
jgi:hypothetical protein